MKRTSFGSLAFTSGSGVDVRNTLVQTAGVGMKAAHHATGHACLSPWPRPAWPPAVSDIVLHNDDALGLHRHSQALSTWDERRLIDNSLSLLTQRDDIDCASHREVMLVSRTGEEYLVPGTTSALQSPIAAMAVFTVFCLSARDPDYPSSLNGDRRSIYHGRFRLFSLSSRRSSCDTQLIGASRLTRINIAAFTFRK